MRLNLVLTDHADAMVLSYLEVMPSRERARAYKQLALAGLALLLQQGLAIAPASAPKLVKQPVEPTVAPVAVPTAAPVVMPVETPVNTPVVTAPAAGTPVPVVSAVPVASTPPTPVVSAPMPAVSQSQGSQAQGDYSLEGLAVDDVVLDF